MFASASFNPVSFNPISFKGLQKTEISTLGGHYADWWIKKWNKQFEKPTIQEIESFVENQPKAAIEALKSVAPSIAYGIKPVMLHNNMQLIQSIADQLLIAIELRYEEDDIEAILLLM